MINIITYIKEKEKEIGNNNIVSYLASFSGIFITC